ncbi:hypothetical protein FRC07_002734, partial [Ceratobasidium sp. 392]
MAPYTISLRPRRGAVALMSALSISTSATSSASLSSQPSTHEKRCFYCPKLLPDNSTRSRHIFDSPACKAAQDEDLRRAAKWQEAERQRTNTGKRGAIPQPSTNASNEANAAGSTSKRRKVTVETVPDEDDMPRSAGPSTPTIPEPSASTIPEPSVPPADDETSPDVEAEPGPSTRTHKPVVGRNRVARCRLRCHGSLYIEDYPDPLAGSPISNDYASPPDLKAHMRSCGTMANPENFEIAELLMTLGLTDVAKDWHLKSTMERLGDKGKRNATIAPLIIATDQTTMSIMCGGQKVYLVYMATANIAKSCRRKPKRRAMVLLGYLPVNLFEDIDDDKERRRLKADLIHRSMERLLEPLKVPSEEGVDMWCLDGRLRRVFPRIAAYTANWPEQNLQLCTSEGSCPNKSQHIAELKPLNLKPVWPWWGDIPDVNLATCFTPDLLHQLYQGIFKTHILRWLRHLVGKKVVDEQLAAIPQAQGLRHFNKGITGISQWAGRESKQIAAQILPVVAGSLSADLTDMVRSLINFMFRAHAASMTDTDIEAMERDLAWFHELKGLLIVHGMYKSDARFDKIPKLHMLSHYTDMIRLMGTPDGFNTEAPEHLHIEYAK